MQNLLFLSFEVDYNVIHVDMWQTSKYNKFYTSSQI